MARLLYKAIAFGDLVGQNLCRLTEVKAEVSRQYGLSRERTRLERVQHADVVGREFTLLIVVQIRC